MRRISIFGATGSIGQSAIDLIRRAPEKYQVVALTGGRNIAQLAKDARELRVELAVTAFPEYLGDLQSALVGSDIAVAAGEAALVEAADRPADWILSAIVGVAGLAPGLRALRQGTTLALANKESLVAAGPLMLREAEQYGATLLPVDSEHSAIFQALVGEDIEAVERIIITASGGAFRDWPIEQLASATLKQAQTHPNWDMGQRITIDSASMFNKALEVIETKEYFGVSSKQIEVIVHPQSLVHALVGFVDGGIMAHVGPSDMRHAIGYALNWPDRSHVPVERLDIAKVGRLDFRQPDLKRWPALRLAFEVIEAGGLTGAAFNAAKETVLDAFIAGQIGFMQMAEVVEEVLLRDSQASGLNNAVITLDMVLRTDHLARTSAKEIIRERQS